MLPDKILQSDLLDILFENKNKTYGAYSLRKSYNNTLRVAITITIFITACFAITLLLHHSKQELTARTFIIEPPDAKLIQPPQQVKPLQKTNPQVNHVRQVINSTPVIVPDKDKTTVPTIDVIDKSLISDVNTDGAPPVDGMPSVQSANSGAGQAVITSAIPADDPNKIFSSAQVMPQFPGGTDALVKFMLRNLHQPDDLQNGETIKVIASFVVNKTGSIENIKIISSGRTDLDKEVLRVMNKMPLWKPGLQNGKPVSVYFNLPVTFKGLDE